MAKIRKMYLVPVWIFLPEFSMQCRISCVLIFAISDGCNKFEASSIKPCTDYIVLGMMTVCTNIFVIVF